MKTQLLLSFILFFRLQNFSQVYIHEIFPVGVCNISMGDTFLNTRAILLREGIRKITSQQGASGNINTVSTITAHLTKQGLIKEVITCTKSKTVGSSFCRSDTVLYDNYGRNLEFRMRSGSDTYIRGFWEYVGEGKVKEIWIIRKNPNAKLDTMTKYRYYNDKEQLVRVESEEKKSASANAYLFYDDDGLPNSVRYDDPLKETYTFKRKQKRGNKEIQLESLRGTHKWVYNARGQYISSEWKPKKPSTLPKIEVNYYYNPNGTLSKVVEKKNGKNYCTTTYAYEKYD